VSKAALLTLKNSLAAEWARYGIRVNSISPGYMDTILNEGDGIAEGRAIWASRNPMGRMGVPGELTGAVMLLSSNAGSYMNGEPFYHIFAYAANIIVWGPISSWMEGRWSSRAQVVFGKW
jgi:NAD(P)-dependent dehydrogenase (short-subunit alcohol dehydrogenase family)